VPVGKKVRILTTANDVIHAWWVPAFAVKQDAVPGFIRDTWFGSKSPAPTAASAPSCAARNTASCPSSSDRHADAEYAEWVDGKKKAMAAAADDPNKMYAVEELKAPRGEKVFAANCAPVIRPTDRVSRRPFPPLDGSKVVLPAAGRADRHPAQRQERYRHGCVQAS
jgi:cytochrome c oxidase subunit 2